MHLGLFVCLSVRARNSRSIAPIDLILFTQEVLSHGFVVL